MEHATRDGLVAWALKPLVERVYRFGPKNRADVPRRNVRHVAASRSSRRGEAIS
jgi:hypothetical protein